MKAAILGAGFISEFHAIGYLAAQDVQLCAVCDADEAKARALAQKFSCAWYTDARTLLERERPALISCCLPTYLHREYVIAALEAGAHVLCEKPMALSVQDCDAMEQAARRTGRVLMTGQVLRWWPEYVKIAGEIRRLGAPLYLSARRLQHPSREGSWHTVRSLGGGALYDLFVHDMDFLLGLMGTDAQITAVSGTRGAGDSWRQVTASLRWPCGTCATVEASNMMPEGYPFTAQLHAQYREAAIDYSFRTAVNIERGAKAQTQLILYDGGAKALELSANAQEEAFKAEIDAFVRGARAGVSPLPAKESVRVMQVIAQAEAMLEAQEDKTKG